MGQARPAGRELVRRGPADLRPVGLRRGPPGSRDALTGEPPHQTSGVTHQAATQRAIEAVWRIESPRLIAALARMMRDVGLAEDLAQDALVAALEKWPRKCPGQPGRLADDRGQAPRDRSMRRARKRDEKHAEIGMVMAMSTVEEAGTDDLLSLMFTCCHPALSMEARVALTLRMVGGLSTPEIARAFLVPRRPSPSGSCVRRRRLPATRSRSGRLELALRLGGVGGRLPDLQRRLRGHGGRRLGPAGSCARTRCGWPRALDPSRRARARSGACWR